MKTTRTSPSRSRARDADRSCGDDHGPRSHGRTRLRTGTALTGIVAAGSLALAGNPFALSMQASQAAAAVTPQVRTSRTTVRPNMLVITADDMRADDLRWMPRTRRLLADRGITFRNSFTTYPLCAPSRASFLTGRYAHNHRVLSVSFPYGFRSFDDSSTLATRLRGAGYRTALVGKYLNGYGTQLTYRTRRPSLHYVPPGWTQWYGACDHDWRRGQWPGGNTYNYMHLTSNVNGVLRTWPGQYTTGVTAGQTQSLVRRFGNASPRKPWFIWWTPVAPHGGGPAEPDDPSGNWATPARPAWVKHQFDSKITHGAGTPLDHAAESDVSDKPAYIRHLQPLSRAEKRAERDVTRQRAEALYVLDLQIARTMGVLNRSGQASRTIVALTSDNGYYLGEHRKREGKITLHEPAVRVPLIMAGPGIPHGVRYDPATELDLAATVASWAGTTLRNADGHSLRPTITGGDHAWARPVLLEGKMLEGGYARGTVDRALMHGMNTSGIRIGRYVLLRYSTGENEVYDLARDPLELHSLKSDRSREIRHLLIETWRQYAACSGSRCQVTLPAGLRTPATTNRQITVSQERARHGYYAY
jgi:N-acetylglucosamine-6-sulfatase